MYTMVRTHRIRSNRRSKKSYGKKSILRKRSLRKKIKKRLKRKIKRNTYKRKNSKMIGGSVSLEELQENTITVLKMNRNDGGLGLSDEEALLIIDNMDNRNEIPNIVNVARWLRVKTYMDGVAGELRFGDPVDINIFREVQREFRDMNMIDILAALQNDRTYAQARQWLRDGKTAIEEWNNLILY